MFLRVHLLTGAFLFCNFYVCVVIFFSFVILICVLFMHVCCVFLNKVWVWVWVWVQPADHRSDSTVVVLLWWAAGKMSEQPQTTVSDQMVKRTASGGCSSTFVTWRVYGILMMLNLLTCKKSAFLPRRGDSLHRLTWNLAWRTGRIASPIMHRFVRCFRHLLKDYMCFEMH